MTVIGEPAAAFRGKVNVDCGPALTTKKTKPLLVVSASEATDLRRSNKLTFSPAQACNIELRAQEVDYLAQPRMTRASTKTTRTNIAIDRDEEATIAA